MSMGDPVSARFAALVEQRLYSPDIVEAFEPPDEFVVGGAAGELTNAIHVAEELAAVSGLFDPRSIPSTRLGSEPNQTLGALYLSCSTDQRDGKVWWLLDKPVRRSALRRLTSEQRLPSTLADPELPPTDGFGRMLRLLLSNGSKTPLDGLTRQDLLDLIAAIETTGEAAPEPRLDASVVRSRIPRTNVLDEYTSVIPGKLIGRDDELAALRAFVASKSQRAPDCQVVTGIGGVGKSALLATCACELAAGKRATVVVLDFDRPGMDAADPYWLSLELARQVGQQRPDAEQELQVACDQARLARARLVNEAGLAAATSESLERSFYSLLIAAGDVFRKRKGGPSTLVVILDTFEEIVREDHIEKARKWIAQVLDAFFGVPVKFIFSGRLVGAGLKKVQAIAGTAEISVEELHPTYARQLLLEKGLDDARATRISNSTVIPRRPLELKLLARLLLDDAEVTVESVEEDLRKGGPDAGKLFGGIVYRRVLLRLKNVDPVVRDIAYPGLILRYLNSELVRKVVLPALHLPPLTDTQAKDAVNTLASYEWLAYRDTAGNVWHQKEMRRAILSIMRSQDPQKARRLSVEAAKHFKKTGKTPAEFAEATYHELLLLTEDSTSGIPSLGEAGVVGSYIGGDVADLPPAARAYVDLATGEPLNVETIGHLPGAHRVEALVALGEKAVREREFGNALEAAQRMPRPRHGEPIPSWIAEAYFATATWKPLSTRSVHVTVPPKSDEAWHLAAELFPKSLINPKAIDWVSVVPATPRQPSNRYDNAQPLERLAVAALLSDPPKKVANYLEQLVARRPVVRRSTQTYGRRMAIARAKYEIYDRDLNIGPALVRLDTKWLKMAREFGAGVPTKRYLDRLISAISRFDKLSAGRRVARRFLTAIDTAEKPQRAVLARLHFPVDFPLDMRYELTRGPDPEFRDPTRFALLEAFNGPDGLATLARVFSGVIPLPLTDLDPKAFADLMATSPEHELVIYVELADRLGKLGDLLKRARAKRPTAEKLAAVGDAWLRWDAAVRAAFKQKKS